jgi:hypothetical protein
LPVVTADTSLFLAVELVTDRDGRTPATELTTRVVNVLDDVLP